MSNPIKATALIEKLQALVAEHGDMNVVTGSGVSDGPHDVDEPELMRAKFLGDDSWGDFSYVLSLNVESEDKRLGDKVIVL